VLLILISWIYLGPDFISRINLGYEKRGWAPLERILTQLRVITFYLSLLIYPHPSRVNLDHDFSVSTSLFAPLTTVLSLAVITGLLGLSLWMVRRNRLVAYALLWFVGNLVIESSIIPLELVFEHRMYLPSMSIIVLGAGMVVLMLKEDWKWWGMGGLLVVSLIFSYWTYERAFVWRDKISLWQDTVEKSPHKARPHSNLGSAYGKKDLYDEAISECRKALAIDPNNTRARSSLGVAYFSKGMVMEAIAEHKKALAIDPDLAEAHYNLGIAYAKENRLDEAIAEYKKALVINPDHAETRNNLGAAYDEAKIEELLQNPGIVRNRQKVNSAIKNAKAFLKIQEEFGSFDAYIWGFVDGKPIQNEWKSISELPVKTDLSEEISKDLKKRGMNFVGPTIIYAFMQAVGMTNDHTVDCFRYPEIKAMS